MQILRSAVTPAPRLAFFTIVGTIAYIGLAIYGWGGFAAFFSHSALIALAIALFLLTGAALFTEGNLSSGVREDRANRWVIVAFALIGVLSAYLPAYTGRKDFWTLDGETIRWIGRRSVRHRRRAAAVAGLCARPPVQRVGRDPARTYVGHQRCLRRHSPPQLSRIARQLAGMGPCLSLGRRHIADSALGAAVACPHPCGREATASPVRRRIRCLPPPHLPAHSWALLGIRRSLQRHKGPNRCRNIAWPRSRRAALRMPGGMPRLSPTARLCCPASRPATRAARHRRRGHSRRDQPSPRVPPARPRPRSPCNRPGPSSANMHGRRRRSAPRGRCATRRGPAIRSVCSGSARPGLDW